MHTKQSEEAPKKTPLIKKILQFTIPLFLGILIIYFFVRDIDPRLLWDILKDANWAILASSLIFGLLGNTIRGYRWELLIRPLGYKPKVWNLNFAIYGGYAVNFALPRAGEIWRCGVVAKDEKIPFSKLFGTMILDRVLDTVTVLCITIIAFFLNMQFLIKEGEERISNLAEILTSPFLYIGLFACIVVIVAIFKIFKKNRFIKKIRDLILSMIRDMKMIWRMKTKNRLFLYTIGIWASYFFYFYLTFFAFDFTRDLGFAAGLVVFSLSSISMGVPSNGGLGPWQVAVIASLAIYGVDNVSATAFATGVFAVQSLWVVLCGLFGMGALAIKNRK